jgi:hypothetical protein
MRDSSSALKVRGRCPTVRQQPDAPAGAHAFQRRGRLPAHRNAIRNLHAGVNNDAPQFAVGPDARPGQHHGLIEQRSFGDVHVRREDTVGYRPIYAPASSAGGSAKPRACCISQARSAAKSAPRSPVPGSVLPALQSPSRFRCPAARVAGTARRTPESGRVWPPSQGALPTATMGYEVPR